MQQKKQNPLASLLDRPIAFNRAFKRITRSTVASLMLSQACYWTPRTKDDEGWFYKSRDEWEEETGLTRTEQETARRILRDTSFWHEKLCGVPACLHYRVDMDALIQELQASHEPPESVQLAEMPPTRRDSFRQQEGTNPADYTTESTTENTNRDDLIVRPTPHGVKNAAATVWGEELIEQAARIDKAIKDSGWEVPRNQTLSRKAFWDTCGKNGATEDELARVFDALEKRIEAVDPPAEPGAYVFVALEQNRWEADASAPRPRNMGLEPIPF